MSEEYKITPEGAVIALRAEELVKDGISLSDAAKAVGLNNEIELRILLLLLPNITLAELEDMEIQ